MAKNDLMVDTPTVRSLIPQNESEILSIARMIERSEGFTLGIAKCNQPVQRSLLLNELDQVLPANIQSIQIELTEPVESLREIIRDHLQKFKVNGSGRKVVHVIGFEHSIPWDDPHPPALSILNMGREGFHEDVPCPLIIWLPNYAVTKLAQESPDFWAWRSGVYEFFPNEELATLTARNLISDGTMSSNLLLAEKRERIDILQRLLDDYRELDEIQESKGKAVSDNQRRIAALLRDLGDLYYEVGGFESAFRHFNQGIEISRKLKDKSSIAITLHQLGMIHQDQGDYEEAIKNYSESMKIEEELGDKGGIAITLHQLGIIHQDQGDYDEAIEKYSESMKIDEELGDKSGIAITLHQLGIIHQDQGDYDEAIEKYSESMKIKEELGNKSGIATTLHQLGNIHYNQGDYEQAIEKYNESKKINEELGDKSGIASTLGQLGMIHQNQGDYEQAIEKYNEVMEIFEELGNKSGIASTLHNLGIIHQDQGDYEQAIEKYNESMKINEELGDKSGIASTLGQLGKLYQAQKMYQDALDSYLSALDIFRNLKISYERLALQDIASIREEVGEEEFERICEELNVKINFGKDNTSVEKLVSSKRTMRKQYG